MPFGPAFCFKIWKTRVPEQHEESSRKWFKKNAIWECSKPRKLAPRAGESTILGFVTLSEKTQFWSGFELSFWSFWELHSQKTRFLGRSENCLVFGSIFGVFWTPQNGSKIDEKSILGLILGQDGSKEVSSWANMAPRTVFWMIFNRFLDQFKLMSDLLWADICSLQEPFFSHFLNRFWIILGWCPVNVGLMFIRCYYGLMVIQCWLDVHTMLRSIVVRFETHLYWP